jgi:hypothetical protein
MNELTLANRAAEWHRLKAALTCYRHTSPYGDAGG